MSFGHSRTLSQKEMRYYSDSKHSTSMADVLDQGKTAIAEAAAALRTAFAKA